MYNIDILLLIGGKSGFEIALRRVGDYLSGHDCNIRFVQMVKTDSKWYSDRTSFVCLGFGKSFTWDEAIGGYTRLLSKKESSPDLVIAAGLPEMVHIAKSSTVNVNLIVPVVYWPHSELSSYRTGAAPVDEILNYADIFFAFNNSIATDIETLYPQKLIYRVNHTIDEDGLFFSSDRNTLNAAFVGRLSEEKRVDVIIKAIARTEEPWTLSIIGSGDEQKNLENLCSDLGCEDRVKFLGWSNSPWQAAGNSRALIISSRDAIESGPLTLIEALASGMPVVSTPLSLCKEIITPGENGYLFPFDSPVDLAEILDVLASNPFTEDDACRCRESVQDFHPQTALWDFLCKTIASCKMRALPAKNWKSGDLKFVKSKMSVIISNPCNEELLKQQLQNLFSQSMEKRYLEVIIVYTKGASFGIDNTLRTYESRYPEQVMLVSCDDEIDTDYGIDLGKEYATGDMLLTLDSDFSLSDPLFLERYYMDEITKS